MIRLELGLVWIRIVRDGMGLDGRVDTMDRMDGIDWIDGIPKKSSRNAGCPIA